MRWTWVAWGWLSGCLPVPVFSARHAEAAAICGWTERAADEALLAPGPVPHAACVDVVLVDLNVDVDAFVAADGLVDAYTTLDGDEDSRLAQLIGAVAALGAADLGQVEDAPGRLREALEPVVEATGKGTLAQALYDYVVGQVAWTVPSDDDEVWATFDPGPRELAVSALPGGVDGAAILVHEARHGDGVEHVPCLFGLEDRAVCDDEPDGAWGVQLSVHEAIRAAAVAPALALDQEGWMAVCESYRELGGEEGG